VIRDKAAKVLPSASHQNSTPRFLVSDGSAAERAILARLAGAPGTDLEGRKF
jgi:hypothetical protein